MKKLIKIGLLLAVFCFAAPVYADGDMPAGNKNCTEKCGLYDGPGPTGAEDKKQDESTVSEIYAWFYEQISGLID